MKLFYDDGHLTLETLVALCSGEALTQLERLEIADHLATCEDCNERMMAIMTDDSLMEPYAPLSQNVLFSIEKNQRSNRWVKIFAGFAVITCAVAILVIGIGLIQSPKDAKADERQVRQGAVIQTNPLAEGRDHP